MKKEVKIILNSGISITITDKDKTLIIIGTVGHDDCLIHNVENIKDIPEIIMNAKDNIIIHHSISTGEYMEYYLTRDKITWCYYSEVPEQEEK